MVKLTHNQGFWLVGIAYFVTMAFSTVPSPLYVLYQARDGFDPLMLTVAFAAYALATMASLYLFGHLSDWFGRRRVLLLAMGIELLAAVLFATTQGLGWLIAARVVCGLAMGLIAGTATAYLFELHAAARPKADRTRGDLLASIAVMGGLGTGALVAGLLTAWAPHPLQTPYWLFLAVMGVLTIVMCWLPETTQPVKPRPSYRPQRVSVPVAARPRFFAAAGASLALYAMLALFSSVAPLFLVKTLGLESHLLSGAVTFAVYAAGALAQVVLRQRAVGQLLTYGLYGMMAGMLLLVLAVLSKNFALFVAAGCIIGAGTGVLFKGCVSTVAQLALASARGETMSALFLTGYVGLSIPVIVLGIATRFMSLPTALLAFTTVFLLVLLGVRRRLLLAAS